MKIYYGLAIALSLVCISTLLLSSQQQDHLISQTNSTKPKEPKIQVAILLDVSNSMDGLIDQARAQLWNMVSILGKATCDKLTPQIEIALYEYGRTGNNAKDGYVKKISDFTSDLDGLSQTLFNLKTDGGDEYCGQVMYTSLTELNWDSATTNYKVIFIAGNEDFLQGNTSYTRACAAAKEKGVIINTIYCGDKMQGIREHWNLTNECGSGTFSNIDQDATQEDLLTPYDSVLFSLNDQLNSTYIAYGYAGLSNFERQDEVDKVNYRMNKSVAAKRVAVKGKKALYNNSTWDMVDAMAHDSLFVSKVDIKTLPDSLQKKSRAELSRLVKGKNIQRSNIQKNIADISLKRELYIAAEKSKAVHKNTTANLETAIEKIIKIQAKRYNMLIE